MTERAAKIRADLLLFERGLAESREQAQALIMEGVVYTPTGRVLKAGSTLSADVDLEVKGRLPFVSRGGLKLAHALDEFQLDVSGLIVLDVGASTGGFTDCVLQRDANKVYAVDVGHGQLHYGLRKDERVSVMEKTNARYPFELPELVDLIVMDVSFISIGMVIPEVIRHLKQGHYIVSLVKPQFESQRDQVGRGGVIKDPKVHASVLGKIVNWAVGQDIRVRNICRSPIQGDSGNREFFILLEKP
ncbi:MAG: TlyA family rRNA (cytidine-2'-O)-methyltransferase [Chloroflexota bacterium]|nr:TlyA family RNA methyltransferase [Dehalococcoidia bacterium]MEE3013464.1 TlyA family RNA methyltransferase [Chloroflexota bacterium]GIS94592.1 MAG: TlyA family rRNA (cytidine-2'-O)-methyltransferase [Dehalococcoidia bacterium]GIT43024.1 MAG: TlyA family rRNA (cytidine-2'-O)-methyltransferase [Chloroflexota bacterium]